MRSPLEGVGASLRVGSWIVATLLASAFALGEEPKTDESSQVKFVNGAGGTEIKVTTDHKEFEYQLLLEQTKKGVSPKVYVKVLRIGGPADGLLECTKGDAPCDRPFDVDALGDNIIRLSGTFESVGTYPFAVSVLTGASRHTVLLTINRVTAATPIRVFAVDKAAAIAGEPVVVRVHIQETSRRRSTLNRPELMALALLRPGDGKVGAAYKSISVTDSGATEIPATFAIPSGATSRLTFTIDGLKEAGEYSGILRFTASDTDPVDQPITLAVKNSAWQASFVIALGVVVSWLIKSWVKSVRPRLLEQRQALGLLATGDEIERELDDLDTREKSILELLRKRLGRILDQIEAGEADRAAETLVELDRKLSVFPAWVNARRRIATLSPLLVDGFRKKADKVKDYLEKSTASAQEASDATEILRTIGDEIDASVCGELVRRVKELGDVVNQGALLASDVIRAEVREATRPLLARASELAAQGRIAEGDSEFRKAQVVYAKGLSGDLKSRLEGSAAPFGFESNLWSVVKGDLVVRLTAVAGEPDPERAMSSFRSVLTRYLSSVAAAAATYARSREDVIQASQNFGSDEEKRALKEAAISVATELEAVKTQIETDQLEAALRGYNAAAAKLKAVADQLLMKGILQGGDHGAPDTAPSPAFDPSLAALTLVQKILPRDVRLRRDGASLTGVIRKLDGLVVFVALVVSVILGLQLLWVSNPVWGSWNDHLVAVLWGLGLHQISGAAFEGMAGAAERLTR